MLRIMGITVAVAFSLLLAVGTVEAQQTQPSEVSLTDSTLLRDLIFAAGWAAGSIVAALAVRILWNHVFLPITRKTRTKLDIMILERSRRSAQWVAAAAVLNAGFQASFRSFPQITGYVIWVAGKGAVYVLLVLSITSLAYAIIHAVIDWHTQTFTSETKAALSNRFIPIFHKIAWIVFLFVAITIILDHFGVQISALLATAGIASLAVALAAQETLSNMFSGLALMVDRPFKVGDRVELASGKMGDVLEIGLRSTRVLAFDNTVITIPNAEISKAQIINVSSPTAHFKIRATIGVAYGSDLRKVKAILLDIMMKHPDVMNDPSPATYFTEFADSSLNLLYICWVADYREQFRIRDELNMAIKDRFEAENVTIPFPQRDVHMYATQGK